MSRSLTLHYLTLHYTISQPPRFSTPSCLHTYRLVIYYASGETYFSSSLIVWYWEWIWSIIVLTLLHILNIHSTEISAVAMSNLSSLLFSFPPILLPLPLWQESKGDVWTPPFRDAAAVIIEKILDRTTIQPIGESGCLHRLCIIYYAMSLFSLLHRIVFPLFSILFLLWASVIQTSDNVITSSSFFSFSLSLSLSLSQPDSFHFFISTGGYTYEDLKRLNLEQKMLSETHEDYATMRTKERKGAKPKSAQVRRRYCHFHSISRIMTLHVNG